ncbi:hypothetical protein Poly24_48850 [Rosistilla carotiformis]|uniref:Uncharacterized protein n=1 Tax=Rosistilla carotiformis TaxID=2528017 RepID=A0A518K028_9BACT|nr:hypothetical protein [Rosistilla carotiformis]QDV71151.1 hypothetical protein Poly24_48850 [Rosistilla carotiformis]
MSTTSDTFDQLIACREDPASVLSHLVDHYRTERLPHELFETLKLQTRLKLGLPLFSTDNDPPVGEELDRQMEMGLIDACREVGQMLMQEGRIAEGWMYLRPVGNLPLVAELMRDIQPNEENTDDLIQVLLHEGIDIARGYQLILENNGTCNSITTYEQSIIGRPPAAQRPAASLLLDHVYNELVESVRSDIEQREGTPPESNNIVELIADRGWLFSDNGYHIDTTHLASTIRFARVLDDPAQLRRAWEMTQYGRKLNRQFQYPGDEPFADFYSSHDLYFSVLLGEKVDEGIAYFERKVRNVDMLEKGTGPIETYVELLDRVGRPAEALAAAVEYTPAEVPATRVVPLMLELAKKGAGYEPIQDFCKARGDLLGYAAALINPTQ